MKILVVGSNPASGLARPHRNTTLNRVKRWMTGVGRPNYDFFNVIQHHVEVERMDDVDASMVLNRTLECDRVLTLGGFASRVLDRLGIEHYSLPHPSPRNRQFNDPSFEQRMLSELVSSRFLHR